MKVVAHYAAIHQNISAIQLLGVFSQPFQVLMNAVSATLAE